MPSMHTLKKYYWVVGVVALLGLLIGIKTWTSAQPSPLDAFAQCITEAKATFYGAFWCPHCQSQKKLFGRSERLLPYVECSTPDSKGQTQVCIDKKITGYPLWEYADGTRTNGQQTLEQLAEKTGCALP